MLQTILKFKGKGTQDDDNTNSSTDLLYTVT